MWFDLEWPYFWQPNTRGGVASFQHSAMLLSQRHSFWHIFYRASACYAYRARYCFSKSVCPSVRLSHSYCMLTNALIIRLFPPSGNGMFLRFWALPPLQNWSGTPSVGAWNTWGVVKLCDFRPKLPFISETVRDRPMVTTEH